MADKSAKIIDVKSPENVAPGASSRPLVVTDRPVLTNDPMMKQSVEAESVRSEEPVISRTAKTIEPDKAGPAVVESTEAPSEPDTESAVTPPEEKPTEPTESAGDPAAQDTESAPVSRDSEAQSAAMETEAMAAQAAREEELEQLITSGKYVVPINARQRKRSRMYVALFCVLAVLLALVLLDALLDAKIVTLPLHLPHTHFFS